MSSWLASLALVSTTTVGTASVSDSRNSLEEAFGKALAGEEPRAPPESSTAAQPSVRLIDLALDLLAAGGWSSADEEEVRSLEAGGHDPKNRGFTVQNVEVTLSGIVDPYLRGDANIVLQIDPEGESVVELEEAYLTTLALPGNLQLKGGQFFTAFGRLNPTHPHAWDFVDQPVVNTRLLGPDGVRNPGLQLSWLTPLPFFVELTASAQTSVGETAASFRSAPEELVAGRTLVERDVKGLQDLMYLARLKVSFDLSDETTAVLGLSGLFGPNAAGEETRTTIGGADLYLKWKPLTNEQGWPFVALQVEAMIRKYEAGPVVVEELGGAEVEVAPADSLVDYGGYAQLIWGFGRPFTAGVRYDFARGEPTEFTGYRSADDPLRDVRHRASAMFTYYPTEFSKLRLQYAYDRASFLSDADAHSVYLQAEITFGAHGAHKF